MGKTISNRVFGSKNRVIQYFKSEDNSFFGNLKHFASYYTGIGWEYSNLDKVKNFLSRRYQVGNSKNNPNNALTNSWVYSWEELVGKSHLEGADFSLKED